MERMDKKWAIIIIMVVIMVEFVKISAAVNICGMDDDGISACKPWVTKPCPADPPPAECCDRLSKADFKCLCSYKDSFLLPSLGIDPDLALSLPAKCAFSTIPTC